MLGKLIFCLVLLVPASLGLKCFTCNAQEKNGEPYLNADCLNKNEALLKACDVRQHASNYAIEKNKFDMELACANVIDEYDEDMVHFTRSCMLIPTEDVNACREIVIDAGQTHLTVGHDNPYFGGTKVQIAPRKETRCVCDENGCNSATAFSISAIILGVVLIVGRMLV